MTYGFCPENWPLFQDELRKRGIATTDIEKVEIGPDLAAEAQTETLRVTVTLRSGRIESWRQPRREELTFRG